MDLALVCFPGGLAVSRSRRDDRSSVSLENTSPIMHNSTSARAQTRATKKIGYRNCYKMEIELEMGIER